MVTIDTQYTVVSTVKFPDPGVSWLSQSKCFSKLDDRRLFVTRDYWARQLGVHYITVKRWEDSIIKPTWELKYLYYDGDKRQGLHGLDAYQRFFLKIIRDMKLGYPPFTKVMTYEEIISYMRNVEGGNPWWLGITREEFNRMQTTYTNKAA